MMGFPVFERRRSDTFFENRIEMTEAFIAYRFCDFQNTHRRGCQQPASVLDFYIPKNHIGRSMHLFAENADHILLAVSDVRADFLEAGIDMLRVVHAFKHTFNYMIFGRLTVDTVPESQKQLCGKSAQNDLPRFRQRLRKLSLRYFVHQLIGFGSAIMDNSPPPAGCAMNF